MLNPIVCGLFNFMKLIPLYGKYGIGQYAIIDSDDFNLVNQYKWYLHKDGYLRSFTFVIGTSRGATTTANRYKGKTVVQKLHRLIIDTPKGMETDHVNRNKLDNRKSNLRICNRLENVNNMIFHSRSSIYHGVSWLKRDKKWTAQISYQSKKINLGSFREEHHAAMAYDIWAKKFHKRFANLNFKSIP